MSLLSDLKLDEWQQKVLDTEGNICLRSGRQVGKSTVISIKAAEYACNNPNKTVLVIASVERQAFLLFDKILAYIIDNYKKKIKVGKFRPTKSKIQLTNGSIIYSLPTGISGSGIRGFTVNLLIADEAAFIPEEVWTAVTPMLAVTRGKIILLSTPHGKEGYYYRCFSDPNFTAFHVSSEDCPRKDVDFLKREKERMTRAEYAQEYLGEFIDELMQFFPTDLIRKCMNIDRDNIKITDNKKFLGVDVARMGGDETVLVSVERINNTLKMIDLDISTKTYLTETINLILYKDRVYNYTKIYIDDGGLGVGVFDPLLKEHEQTKRKVEPINNSQRSLDKDDKRRKKLLKEDLYSNLLRLMEQGNIDLFNRDEVFLSLKSIQYEYTDDGSIKIHGNYSHIVEALIRAAWCIKDKSLNIYIY